MKMPQSKGFDEKSQASDDERSIPIIGDLMTLNPKRADALLPMCGRLSNPHLNFDAKFAVILPFPNHVNDPFVQQTHAMEGHTTNNHVLSITQKWAWTLSGKATVERAIKWCMQCLRPTSAMERHRGRS